MEFISNILLSVILARAQNIIEEKFHNHTKIYTDTFKSVLGNGFAIIVNQSTKLFKQPDHTSVFTAEEYYVRKETIVLSNYLDSNQIVIDSLSAKTSNTNQ